MARAWLELIECGAGATCTLAVGERLLLDRDVVLGRVPGLDVVMMSPGQGGRKNCGIEVMGTGHRLRHFKHGGTIQVNGAPIDDHHDLAHGDAIEPGARLRFRYVVEGGDLRPSIGALVDRFGDRLLFQPEAQGRWWRCVPFDDPGAEPQRAALCADPARALNFGSRGLLVDGDRRAALLDDVAGASLLALLEATRGQGRALEPVVVAAIVRPIAALLAQRPAHCCAPVPSSIHVTWSGAVCFDGVAQAVLWQDTGEDGAPAGDDETTLAEALARTMIDAGVLGFEADDPEAATDEWHTADAVRWEEGRRSLAERAASVPGLGAPLVAAFNRELPADALGAFWGAVAAWCAGFDAVPAPTLAGLVQGLFAPEAARERALRAQLAALDTAGVRALLG